MPASVKMESIYLEDIAIENNAPNVQFKQVSILELSAQGEIEVGSGKCQCCKSIKCGQKNCCGNPFSWAKNIHDKKKHWIDTIDFFLGNIVSITADVFSDIVQIVSYLL